MKYLLKTLFTLIALTVSTQVFAGKTEFCAGFKEGYKTIKGNRVIVPICPIAPITPIGSTDFREGLKRGIHAAKKQSITAI